MKMDALNNIENRLVLVSEELKSGFSVNDMNSVVLEDVLGNNLPILNGFKGINNFEDVLVLEKASKRIFEIVRGIREELDLKDFLKSNKHFDEAKLRELYVSKGLKKKFPKFNINKYFDLLNNPPLSFKNLKGQLVNYGVYWVKKMLIAVNQMIFNEMDIYILNIGKEGAGKSAWSSQQILWFYNVFFGVGLIEYVFDVKRMFFADLLSFLNEHEVQERDDFFKIECLDEANELNRSNFRDENIQQFKYDMRTGRKDLRIILLNMQQIGELDTSVSLSRVNFIYDCKMNGDLKSGTLNKGFGDMYIIPRDDFIFSDKYKKVFSRNDILNAFANKLDKKKNYYTGLPREFMVADFCFADVWGFDKDEYDKYIKAEAKGHKFNRSIKLTTLQAYILFSRFKDFKKFKVFDLGFEFEKNFYDVLYKFFGKLGDYWDDNPDRFMYYRNKEEKELKRELELRKMLEVEKKRKLEVEKKKVLGEDEEKTI